jgi:hypothetical protein
MSRNMHAVTDYNQGESIGSGGECWQEGNHRNFKGWLEIIITI